MNRKALVVIDIQNDITKHYRDIIENINSAIDWAMKQGMAIIYIKHNICPLVHAPSSQVQKEQNLCRSSRSYRIIFSLRQSPTR